MAPPRMLLSRSLQLYQRTRLPPPLRLPSTSLIPLPSSPLRLTFTPFNSRVHFPAPVFFSTATPPNNKKDTPSIDQEEAVSALTPLTTDGDQSESYEDYEWSDDQGEELTNVFEMTKRKLPLPGSWPDLKRKAYESRIGIESFLVAKGFLEPKPIPKRVPSNTYLLIRLLDEFSHLLRKKMMLIPPVVNSRRSRHSRFARRLKEKRQGGDNN